MSHYISVDSKNRIIDGFSDAFKQPNPTDICILDDPMLNQRQFMLNDQINPQLITDDGLPLYKLIDGTILCTTPEDNSDIITDKQKAISDTKPTLEQRVDMMQSVLDNLLMGGMS